MPKIKELRIKNEVHQEDLATLLNLDVPTISKAENGVINLTPAQVKKLQKVYKCELKDIYEYKEIKYSEQRYRGFRTTVQAIITPQQRVELKTALKILGYSNIGEFIRIAIDTAIKSAKEKSHTTTEDFLQKNNNTRKEEMQC